MIDFEFKFRWLRALYITALAVIIYFVAGWIPAGICMLAIFDIIIDKSFFNPEEELDLDDNPDISDRDFGPNT